MTLVTKNAPDFTAQAVLPDGTFGTYKLSEQRGKYVLLFFYPMDFTFVCPTEIVAFDKAMDRFNKLGVEVVSVSVDSVYSHFAWRSATPKEGGIGQVKFPMVSDITKNISKDYGVLLEEAGIALRGLFLIDKNGIVRHELINDLPLGRSVDEAIRMIEALQFFEKNGEVCPANWHSGDEAVKPDADGIAEYLGKNA